MCWAFIFNVSFHFSIIWTLVLSNSVIPDGFQKEAGLPDYYKFHSESVSWIKARETCNNERAHLAYMRTVAEETFLRSKGFSIWIGMHDKFVEGQWVSVLDEPVEWFDHIHWGFGEPDDFEGNEDCAEYHHNRKEWNDKNCNSMRSFFCMIPAK